jgi:hypothetical protein
VGRPAIPRFPPGSVAACSFINQPVEVAALRPALAGLVGAPNRRPDLVLRFGHGPTLPNSFRRPVEAVIEQA